MKKEEMIKLADKRIIHKLWDGYVICGVPILKTYY